jgi:phosphatidyl-myo-inositol dimannoside synthase
MAVGPAIVVSELFPPAIGGSAVLLGEIYSRISAVPVHVVTDPVSSAGPLPPAMAHLRITHRALATPHWGVMRPRGVWHHLRTSTSLIRIARPRGSVLHCGRALPEGLWAWMTKILTGTPYVCWSHGEDASSAWASREYHVLMPRIYNAADAVLANSRNTARILSELGVDASRVTVVYPGVDTVRFSPGVDGRSIRRRHGLEGKFVLLSVARIERRKGHDLVLQALARLVPALPSLHYLIVGDGGERARLEAMTAELGLGRCVTFAGKVTEADLPRYYAACDVFAHPNRVEGTDLEGFGLVFLEAAASGRPSIGGNSGGVPEAVQDAATGLLVSGTDTDELAQAIARLHASPAHLQAMGAAARDRVVREFDWARAARAVEAVHQRVSSGGSGRS